MPIVDNKGMEIYFEIEGDGPPLAILHGITDSTATWRELGYVDALKENFRLLLIDARGHGQSGKPHEPEAYLTKHIAADVAAVLDAVEAPKAHLFGYSMGARTALATAKHYPERVSAMVLGGVPSFNRPPQGSDPFIEVFEKGSAAIAELWDAPLSPTLRARLEENDVDALIALRRCRMISNDLADVLANIAVPCLVFGGDEDPNYPAITQAAADIANAEFVTFPGLNHAGTLFRSDLVLPHVQKFLLAQV
jgi:pimeloyl-ACP methyl ester carboxylesterase